MSETQIRLGPIGWLRWIWRQLTTMKVALYLLLILALAAIPGSVFPQRGASPLKVKEYFDESPELALWLDRLGMFDVYGSAWFSAVYLLLVISLIGCIVPRTPRHIADLRKSPAAPPRDAWSADGTSDEARESALLDLGKINPELAAAKLKFRRKSIGSNWITIDKGIARESGNLLFHASLLGVLLAIAVGSLFGYRGQVIVREGNGFSNVLAQYDSFTGGRLFQTSSLNPFYVKLERMEVDFEPSGAPSDFRAILTNSERPGETLVGVNLPLDIGNASVFLVGHGYAPIFQVEDEEGNVGFDDSVVFLPQDSMFTSTGVVKVPDLDPQLGIEAVFAPTAAADEAGMFGSAFPSPIDPAVQLTLYRGDLGLDDGVAQNVYQLDKSGLEEVGSRLLRPGEVWKVPGVGSITFKGVERFATFNIGSDPGQTLALFLVLLTIGSMCVMLFVRRRQVWLLWDEQGNARAVSFGVNAERDLANLARTLGIAKKD